MVVRFIVVVIAVELVVIGEVVEHVGGTDEAGDMALHDGVVEEVLGEHGLADAVGTEEHDVGGVMEELEGEEFIDEGPVDSLGPQPVEVGEGFEGADAGVGQTPLEASSLSLGLFDVEELLHPGGAAYVVIGSGESVEAKGAKPLSQRGGVIGGG